MSVSSSSIKIEEFPQNKIDKDVQSLLFPINLLKNLVFHPKYHIKRGLIFPNNYVIKLISLSATVFCLSCHFYNYIAVLLDDNMTRYQTVRFLYFASTFDVYTISMGFIMNYVTQYIQTKENVTLVLTFQKVHRFLKNDDSKKTYIISWIYIVFIIVFYIICAVYINIEYSGPPWYTTFHAVFVITLDSDTIYAIQLIRLLIDKLVLWTNQALNSREDGDNIECSQEMFETYAQILKCYKIVRKHYQATTFYKTTECFFHELINCQILIAFYKYSDKRNESHFVQGLIYSWLIKNLALQTMLGMQLEEFYLTVENAQNSCSVILGSNCTDEERKLFKNVIRLHRSSFKKMSVFGMFYIDICHPLRLLALLTNYTIVLLQFAFL